jgi:hypothetical protein
MANGASRLDAMVLIPQFVFVPCSLVVRRSGTKVLVILFIIISLKT